MRDDEWQAAYDAGRDSVSGLADAVWRLLVHEGQEVGHAFEDTENPYYIARTALEKYRGGGR